MAIIQIKFIQAQAQPGLSLAQLSPLVNSNVQLYDYNPKQFLNPTMTPNIAHYGP